MESVEREMERVVLLCLWTSLHPERPFSRDKPSSPFRIPFHPEPYCHHDPHPGISLFSSMENEVCGFENLSLSSPHFRPLWYGRMRRDGITHFQEVRVQRPKELDHQWTDAISLALLFFIFLTGFLLTGIRNKKKEYQSFLTFLIPQSAFRNLQCT